MVIKNVYLYGLDAEAWLNWDRMVGRSVYPLPLEDATSDATASPAGVAAANPLITNYAKF